MISRMARLGLRVPPAFVLPTSLCLPLNRGDPDARAALKRALREGVAHLETITGRSLGDRRGPLLVSVRSGAARSMPGMLSTVLNVGLNADTVRGLIRQTGNPRLAWDSYRRFVQGYAEVVGDAPADAVRHVSRQHGQERGRTRRSRSGSRSPRACDPGHAERGGDPTGPAPARRPLRSTDGGGERGLPLLGQPSRPGLSAR